LTDLAQIYHTCRDLAIFNWGKCEFLFTSMAVFTRNYCLSKWGPWSWSKFRIAIREVRQKNQSAQAPLLRDRQFDQSLTDHLVGSKRLRSFWALMAQDIGGFHGNSQGTKIFSVGQ